MKYKLESEFKSLEPFEKDLPDFVILTGVNGVGKTQILQALTQTGSGLAKIRVDNLAIPVHNIRYIESKQLAPNDLPAIGRGYHDESYEMELHDQLFPAYTNLINYKNNFKHLPKTYEIFIEYMNQNYGHMPISTKKYREIISFIEEDPNNRPNTFEFFKDHFHKNYHPEVNDLFTHNFSLIFKNYHSRQERNFFHEYLNITKGEKISYLSSEEFLLKNGNPPWENINKILIQAQMPYRFEVPQTHDPETNYEPRFIKISSKASVKISDLSSGEKILISLAFALYNKEHTSQLPRVLLLDETDASLHQSMTKQYLNILKDVFVKDLGIKVIITTHSPSTVALADEKDIFVVENSEQRIRKCSKDEALSVLTAGVPSLSINYENRKQVFVESPYDVKYYDAIYKILSPYLNKEVSLNFISSGDSRTDQNGDPVANCSQVKHITQTMRNHGNKSCFGIIDWDLTNQETEEGILVNAFSQQYSIENCLLNPLFIGLLILALKTGSQDEISHRYISLNYNSAECLQEIHDWILNKIESQFQIQNQNKISIQLINGVTIDTPEWFTHHQGHELESKILNQISELNKVRQNKEEKLKLEIINKIFDDFPLLVPIYFKDAFSKIQTS